MKVEYESLSSVNKNFEPAFLEQFQHFLSKGWYILGDQVSLFENQFAGYLEAKSVVGVANGLDALILSIEALGLPKNSEIIVPANTYIATILSILRCGFIPVLVEPDILTYNIDPTKIEKSITKLTKVILVVHMYGKPCDMISIMSIANKHNIIVIEDCAQAHGAQLNGVHCGNFGNISAFSFYPTKNLGCLGDGGAIATNDLLISEKIKILRNYGSKTKYYNELIGYNSRLDELQACFLNIKLKSLDEINNHKIMLAKQYFDKIKNELLILPTLNNSEKHVFHIFNVRTTHRDKLKTYLSDNGIKTEIHYPIPPHKQLAYKDILAGNYPITEEIHNTTLSLPISFGHTLSDINYVIDVLNNYKAE
jgi:dTDP-4-amino-4,6-dideoxygalactose transaminase